MRLIAGLFLALVLAACTAAPTPTEMPVVEATTESEPFKVAFVFVGPTGDLGWTWAHNEGRLAIEKEFGDEVETTYAERVPEGPEAERVIRDFAQKGNDLIFTTSYGYQDATLAVAKEYPDTQFVHISGHKTATNSSQVFGKLYQPRYAAGMAAAPFVGDGFIGYVGAFAYPEVLRNANALALGCQRIKPDCEVRVVWTNTWFGPPEEKQAADALLSVGATVIAIYQDTVEGPKAARDAGKVSVGNDTDMSEQVGDSVLTGPIWNWGPKYVEITEKVRGGTYNGSELFNGGMDTGIVQLAPLNRVPDDVRSQIEKVVVDFENGIDTVFCGPIIGANGNLIVEEGKCLTPRELTKMEYFVAGVSGDVGEEAPTGLGEDDGTE